MSSIHLLPSVAKRKYSAQIDLSDAVAVSRVAGICESSILRRMRSVERRLHGWREQGRELCDVAGGVDVEDNVFDGGLSVGGDGAVG
jgi:hypothetical protein